MIIEPDIKLDFKDVLIRPKRSTLTTRKEVDLNQLALLMLNWKYPIKVTN